MYYNWHNIKNYSGIRPIDPKDPLTDPLNVFSIAGHDFIIAYLIKHMSISQKFSTSPHNSTWTIVFLWLSGLSLKCIFEIRENKFGKSIKCEWPPINSIGLPGEKTLRLKLCGSLQHGFILTSLLTLLNGNILMYDLNSA